MFDLPRAGAQHQTRLQGSEHAVAGTRITGARDITPTSRLNPCLAVSPSLQTGLHVSTQSACTASSLSTKPALGRSSVLELWFLDQKYLCTRCEELDCIRIPRDIKRSVYPYMAHRAK